jgi:tetratricopeptide (TPR) repeat protein
MAINLKYILLIVFLTFIVYFCVLQNGFVWDDHIQILENNYINDISLDAIKDAFIPGKTSKPVYTPLGDMFHKIYYYLWKTNPFWYHLIILVYFILNLILIYFIVLRLFHKEKVSFLAALFFLVHPVHVETVAWIGCGMYVLASLFLLLSFYFFIRFLEEKKILTFVLSILFYILSLLSHHFPVVFPLLLLLYIYCFHKDRIKSYFILSLPFWILTLFDVYLSINVVNKAGRIGYNYHETPLIQICNILGKYVLNIVIPVNLSPKYLYPLSNSYSIVCILSLVAIAVIIYLTKSKDYFFCCAWFFICLLPYSHIIPLAWKMADRYLYFASFGFCLFLALICEKTLNKRLSGGIIILIALFYSIITVNMVKIWKDDLSLWQYTEKKSPESTFVIKNLALSYLDFNLPDDSLCYFRKLADLNTEDYEVYSYIALIEFRNGNYEEAIKNYIKAIQLNPDSSELHRNLAIVYYNKGESRLCVKEYILSWNLKKRSYKMFPGYLGMIYHDRGFLERTILYYQWSLRVTPDAGEIKNLLYLAYLEKILYNRGEKYSGEDLAVLMKKTDELSQIAINHLSAGKEEEGEKILKDILLFNPFSFEVNYNLGLLYYKKKDLKRSRFYFREALNIDPSSAETRNYMDKLLKEIK